MRKHGQEVTRTYTLVDEYIRQLADLGISLESLELLGDFKFSEEDKKLTEKELIEKILEDEEYKEQKKTIEKYITEFVKADLMTQEIHRRRGFALTDIANLHDDWVDGGVYLFRTKQKGEISTNLEIDSDEIVKEVNGTEYIQMQYVTPEEFDELVEEKSKKIRYKYTINEDTGELQIAQVKTIETKKTNESNIINSLFTADSTEVIIEDIISIDYKSYIEKYTMPYEFLINLCMVTQNPEFVYHVAQLARETNIMLAVQDDTTVEHITTIETQKYATYENKSGSSTSGASKTSEETQKIRYETITTTMVPHMQVEYANTWSFFEQYEYTKTVKQLPTTTNSTNEKYSLPSTLPNHHEGGTQNVESAYGGYETVTTPEKWTGTFLIEKIIDTETNITVTTYNPGILKNSVEKSKQFLGLLRNSTGECNFDCNLADYSILAASCAKFAVFDREGINVEYNIPNSTRTDDALSNLKSGEQMLYDLMGESIKGDENQNAENDYKSQYKSKMSGLIEHMKYLMTFPENENIDWVDETIDWIDETIDSIIPGDDDKDEGQPEEHPQESQNMVQAAEKVHKYVRTNGYKYKQVGITVPSYRTEKTIDCSSYVTWVILNAGYRSSNFKENMYQWSSATYNKNPEGWQTISSISNARAGDILCYSGHVEIYTGSCNGSKPIVYNCGGTKSISFAETGKSGHTISQITKILRVPI